jgi:4-amino-4-deoxy-L-arabinose transferase-like glycosyltransferase
VKAFSPRFQFILLVLLFASLLTVVFLNHSAWRGRLQYDIDYEDVITYLDGLKRYRALVDQPQGHLQFVYQYVTDPPHAPLHSFQAAVAFAVFGVQDWAPYASNVILLFLLFLAFVYSAKQFGGWALAVGLGYLALSPLAYNTIAEFRPDYPSAILTVCGVLFYLDFLRSGKMKFCALAGACYGLAMLAKPPVFLYVMAIGGGPFFLGLAMGWRESRWGGVVGAIKNAWPFFAACALVAGPHFAVAAAKIYDYIVLNQVGQDAHLWAFQGGWIERIFYPLSGYGGWIALGRMWRIALGLALASGLAGVILWKFKRPEAKWFLVGFGMVFYSYLFLVINPHMNPYFGITFQIFLLFSGAGLLGYLVTLRATLPWLVVARVFVGVILAFVFIKAFPLPVRAEEITKGPRKNKEFVQNANQEALRILADHISIPTKSYVMVSTYGVISSHTLQWISDKEELGFRFQAVPYEDFDGVKKLFEVAQGKNRVDFAIVSEEGVWGVKEALPNARTSGPLLEILEKNPDFTHIGKVPDPEGRAYFIFKRNKS